ncbi:MAG: 7-cyano-7-deazaguanine synthase [Paludibacteraceae bacterium]
MKILLGMSGGIDSSMSALILQQQGYEVIGISFRFLENDQPLQDAVRIAEKLKIQHVVLDARELFQEKVIRYFTSEYLAGRTPFPCAQCNNELKWRLIFEQAEQYGCLKVAMGHYVKIVEENGRYFISEGKDKEKDQSFFLWGLRQEQLKNIVFPLGDYLKSEIKSEAAKHDFMALKEKKRKYGGLFLQR